MISSWFVEDLALSRKDARANHTIEAIGSSSLQKCRDFAARHIPDARPTLYGSYAEVYSNPNVDCVYIGTPHAFHKQNCLDAIKAGKNVLCEKPFAMNAKEAREVIEAARAKGVFLMEAMWTRFYPLVLTLQGMLHKEKVIGEVYRMFADFGLDIDLKTLKPGSRYKDVALGAGSLLDIGIYSLTWGLVCLDAGAPDRPEKPAVNSAQTLEDGVDVASSMILYYPSTGRQGILTSTTLGRGDREFARIEGSEGVIKIEGPTSSPESFTVFKRGKEPEKYDFEKPGRGFYWEADACAVDIKEGKKQVCSIHNCVVVGSEVSVSLRQHTTNASSGLRLRLRGCVLTGNLRMLSCLGMRPSA